MLDTHIPKSYNNLRAEVAQLVEQRTENPRVPSSILGLGTIKYRGGSSSAVERLLAKEEVASSNLVFRSTGNTSRSGGMVDAAVSKTVGGRPPCRFESDLRHQDKSQQNKMPSCVVVARGTLNPLALVRIQARQPPLSRATG